MEEKTITVLVEFNIVALPLHSLFSFMVAYFLHGQILTDLFQDWKAREK